MTEVALLRSAFDSIDDGSLGLESAMIAGVTLVKTLTPFNCSAHPNATVEQVVQMTAADPLWRKIREWDRHPYDNIWIDQIRNFLRPIETTVT